MSLIGRMAKRIRAVSARRRLEREMQDEMLEHVERAAERFRARGMTEAEAMLAARREFGNVGLLQEEARDARGARWIESVWGDLRHALRQFARTPLMTGTIIVTLTFALGISAAAFSAMAGSLYRPAPGVPADPSLVSVRGIALVDIHRESRPQSYPEVLDYAGLAEFDGVAGWSSSQVVVQISGHDPAIAEAQYVTPTFFRVLGLRPLGPGFLDTSARHTGAPELTAFIGYSYAVDEFGSPEAAIGKTLAVNGVTISIIGVAPPRFIGVSPRSGVRHLWIPASAMATLEKKPADLLENRSHRDFYTVARLAPGVSMDRALAAVKVVAARANAALPPQPGKRRPLKLEADVAGLRAYDVTYRSERGRTEDLTSAGLVLGLVALIILVCTTTVSSLLVGAAITRRHEIAVRLALGASRGRLIRQLLTESAGLSLAGAVAGVALYAAISQILHGVVVEYDIDLSWTTAFATALVAVATSLLCGLSPALHATRDALGGVLKESSITATVRSRLQRFLVVAQVALSQPLLFGLAALVTLAAKQITPSARQRLGESVVEARFQNWTSAAKAENRLAALRERFAELPEVVSVVPQSNAYMLMRLEAPLVDGEPPRTYTVRFDESAPEYFKTAGIRFIKGRTFTREDSTSRTVSLVIASDFAAKLFPGHDAVGRRLRVLGDDNSPQAEAEIVGVVDADDTGNSEIGSTMRVFSPLGGRLSTRWPPDAMLIRTQTPAQNVIPTLLDIARREAPFTPVLSMQTLAQVERHKRMELLQGMGALALGGVLTLLLAAVGLYAVVGLSVGQRRREIGVRVSLGAQPGQVVAMFFRSGLRVSLIGLAIGVPLSAAMLRIVGTQVGLPRTNLVGVSVIVAVSVVAVASLASWIPARRAAGVDPLIALRDG